MERNGHFLKSDNIAVEFDPNQIKPSFYALILTKTRAKGQLVCTALKRCLEAFPNNHPARKLYMNIEHNVNDQPKDHSNFHINIFFHPQLTEKLTNMVDCFFKACIYIGKLNLHDKNTNDHHQLTHITGDEPEPDLIDRRVGWIGQRIIRPWDGVGMDLDKPLNFKSDYACTGENIFIRTRVFHLNPEIFRDDYFSVVPSTSGLHIDPRTVHLVSDNGYSIECRVDMLTAQSGYFAALFDKRWSAANIVTEVVIDEITNATLNCLVDCLQHSCFDEPKNNMRVAVELIVVANKYFFLTLEEKLLNLVLFQKDSYFDNNVGSLFILLTFLCFTRISWEVQCRLVDYLKLNADEIIATHEYEEFITTFPEAAQDIMNCMGLKCILINDSGQKLCVF